MFNTETRSIIRALFQGVIHGVLSQIYEENFPPCGLAGTLDWYFQGKIYAFIQAGKISGRKGECVYVPLSKNHQTYHFFFVGGGALQPVGKKLPASDQSLQAAAKNLRSFGHLKMGISLTDLGYKSLQSLQPFFQEIPLWTPPLPLQDLQK